MEEPPVKRQRVDGVTDKKDEWSPVVRDVDDELGVKYTREVDVGITEYMNKEFEGFDCILKYKYVLTRWGMRELMCRYSDFVVNEVGIDGEVVVLKEMKYENPAAQHQKKEKSQKTDQVAS